MVDRSMHTVNHRSMERKLPAIEAIPDGLEDRQPRNAIKSVADIGRQDSQSGIGLECSSDSMGGQLNSSADTAPELEWEEGLSQATGSRLGLQPRNQPAEGLPTHNGPDLVTAVNCLLALQEGNQAATGETVTGLGREEASSTPSDVRVDTADH